MSKIRYEGVSFGFKILLIWLTILTGYIMYDKIISVNKIHETIVLPPQIEIIGDIDYDLNE